jgi:hypothetical protein
MYYGMKRANELLEWSQTLTFTNRQKIMGKKSPKIPRQDKETYFLLFVADAVQTVYIDNLCKDGNDCLTFKHISLHVVRDE